MEDFLAKDGIPEKLVKLHLLSYRFQQAKSSGHLNNSTEATIRTWIDDLLKIFGWDVHNTRQVLTERSLGRTERNKLQKIGSSNSRPDYTFVNGSVPIAFLGPVS